MERRSNLAKAPRPAGMEVGHTGRQSWVGLHTCVREGSHFPVGWLSGKPRGHTDTVRTKSGRRNLGQGRAVHTALSGWHPAAALTASVHVTAEGSAIANGGGRMRCDGQDWGFVRSSCGTVTRARWAPVLTCGPGLWLARGSPLGELRKTLCHLAHVLSCFWSSSPVSQPDGPQTSAPGQPALLPLWTPMDAGHARGTPGIFKMFTLRARGLK